MNSVSGNDTNVVQSWGPKTPFWAQIGPKFQIFKNNSLGMHLSCIYCYISGFLHILGT